MEAQNPSFKAAARWNGFSIRLFSATLTAFNAEHLDKGIIAVQL
jgi:hypothetical protein